MFFVGFAGFMSSILCCIFVIEGKSERDLALFVVITLAYSSVAFRFTIRLPCLLVQSRFAAAAFLFVTSVLV